MQQSSEAAAACLRGAGASACTDVSGLWAAGAPGGDGAALTGARTASWLCCTRRDARAAVVSLRTAGVYAITALASLTLLAMRWTALPRPDTRVRSPEALGCCHAHCTAAASAQRTGPAACVMSLLSLVARCTSFLPARRCQGSACGVGDGGLLIGWEHGLPATLYSTSLLARRVARRCLCTVAPLIG